MGNRGRRILNWKILLVAILLLAITGGGYWAYQTYQKVFGPSVDLPRQQVDFYIPSEADYNDVKSKLYQNNLIADTSAFTMVAKWMKYLNHINPGRYAIKDGMSHKELVELLRSGKQKPIKFTIHRIRYKPELAGLTGSHLEADSSKVLKLANDSNYVDKFGFNTEDFLAMIIPNTYKFYWNTSAREFYNRMHTEYQKFWTQERIKKADAINLTKREVIILASIVQEESNKQEEWPTIAGVYLNRLKRGWKLQADPTLKYLVEDREEVNRIYNKDKTIQSPYNTYQNKGLPPGPIVVPQIQAIDAVLNAEDHEYMYFSAKADLSGYHHFSKTLREHINRANEYQRALNKRNIY